MALKILIADQNEAWAAQVQKYFINLHYEASVVSNGRDAQLALYNDKYFAIIMNFEIKNHSCLQVLKFIKSSYTNQRVILVVDNPDLLPEGDASLEKFQKLGVAELAIRPFELVHLKELLEGHQSIHDIMAAVPKKEGVSPEQEVSMTDENFSQIKIDEFYSSQAVLFDIYIKINDNKYLKILHAGDSFSKDRLEKYKSEKKVETLYFHNSDRRKFIQYNNFLSKKLMAHEMVPVANKVTLLKNVTEKYIEEVHTIGLRPQVIEQGKEVCESVYQLIEGQDDLYLALKSFQNFDPNAYSHGFLVTLYATAIIKQFDWQSKSTIETTAMACMFHDIGMTMLPREFLTLRPDDMTPLQLEQYRMHPEYGYQLLDKIRSINHVIKQIVLQHHEAYDGSGFPFGKKGSKILTLSNIVRLADDFVSIMVDHKLQPTEALRKILVNKEQVKRYHSLLIENFIKVFVDPDKLQKDNNLPANSRLVNKKAS